MPLEFVASKRGKNHLVFRGYRYIFDKSGRTENIWCCVEKRNAKCPGRAYTANNEVARVNDNHNHTPDAVKIEIKRLRENIKEAAETKSDPATVIIASCTQEISASASAQLPALRSMKRTVRKDRAKSNNSLAIPTSLTTLHIPDKFRQSLRGEQFLLHDSGAEDKRILIFGTAKNLQFMQNSTEWFSDGTFKVTPLLFDQLYTIHAVRFNKVFPGVFALLPDRTQKTYTKMLNALKNLNPDLRPRSIMTDFEMAAKNAFKEVFPDTEQTGCHFHLGQCFWRRIQKLPEVHEKNVNDADYALKVKCLTALAFIPPEDVQKAFRILISDEFYSSSRDMEALVVYMEDNWIGGNRRGKERPPRFAIADWNVFFRVADDVARTNNAVEGWHRGFQSQLGATHPTIWKFIETIKSEQSLTELQYEQLLAGANPQPKRKRFRDINIRLRKIVEDYDTRPVVEYLTGIAHNINLNV